MLVCPRKKIGHDEKVWTESFIVDDLKLVIETFGLNLVELPRPPFFEVCKRPIREHLSKCLPFFNLKLRKIPLAQLQRHFTPIGDTSCILNGFRTIGKALLHVLSRHHRSVVFILIHAVELFEGSPAFNAIQNLPRFHVLRLEVKCILCRNNRNTELAAKFQQTCIRCFLLSDLGTINQLEIIVSLTKNIHVPTNRLLCFRNFLQLEKLIDLPHMPTRERNQSFTEFLDELLVDTRLVIKSLKKSKTRKLNQILVA